MKPVHLSVTTHVGARPLCLRMMPNLTRPRLTVDTSLVTCEYCQRALAAKVEKKLLAPPPHSRWK